MDFGDITGCVRQWLCNNPAMKGATGLRDSDKPSPLLLSVRNSSAAGRPGVGLGLSEAVFYASHWEYFMRPRELIFSATPIDLAKVLGVCIGCGSSVTPLT